MEYSRRKRIVTIFCVVVLILSFHFVEFSYANEKGIRCRNITQDDAIEQFERINFQTCSWDQIMNTPLKRLLVAENWIAFGTVDDSVGILDPEGQHIFAFCFDARGGDYELFYDLEFDCITLKIDRNIASFVINLNGEIQIIDGAYDTEKSVKDNLAVKKKKPGIGYRLTDNGQWINKMLQYKTQIIRLEKDEARVFYDNGKVNALKHISVLLIVAFIFILYIPFFILRIKRFKGDPKKILKRNGIEIFFKKNK